MNAPATCQGSPNHSLGLSLMPDRRHRDTTEIALQRAPHGTASPQQSSRIDPVTDDEHQPAPVSKSAFCWAPSQPSATPDDLLTHTASDGAVRTSEPELANSATPQASTASKHTHTHTHKERHSLKKTSVRWLYGRRHSRAWSQEQKVCRSSRLQTNESARRHLLVCACGVPIAPAVGLRQRAQQAYMQQRDRSRRRRIGRGGVGAASASMLSVFVAVPRV